MDFVENCIINKMSRILHYFDAGLKYYFKGDDKLMQNYFEV